MTTTVSLQYIVPILRIVNLNSKLLTISIQIATEFFEKQYRTMLFHYRDLAVLEKKPGTDCSNCKADIPFTKGSSLG